MLGEQGRDCGFDRARTMWLTEFADHARVGASGMGLISELLENDKDGSLRRHIFRITQVAGYVFVAGLVLFLGGLTWRMFTGSEVELFGIRVATHERAETAQPPAAAPPVATIPPAAPVSSAPATPSPANPAPAQPISAAQHLRGTFFLNAWVSMQGDFETCMLNAAEAFAKIGISSPNRAASEMSGQFMRPNGLEAHLRVRCMHFNGFSVAFLASISPDRPMAQLALDEITREFNAKVGPQLVDRYAGTNDKQHERYSWMLTRFPNVEACREYADLAISKLKPALKTYDGPGVFSLVDGVRATILCIQQEGRITAMMAANGFNRDEVHRVRDALVREMTPMQRR